MPLVELFEDVVAGRLECRHGEETTGRPQAGPDVAVAKDVLDLGGDVEGELGECSVHGLDHASGVMRAVEEIGIPEGDVAGSHVHEPSHIGEDDVVADQAGTPVVDHGHRAMPAAMRTPVAGLDISDQTALAAEGELRVTVQTGQEVAGGKPEPAPPELHHGVRLFVAAGVVGDPVPMRGSRPRRRGQARTPRRWRGPPPAGTLRPRRALRRARRDTAPCRDDAMRISRHTGRASRMAVCMGTEQATASAHESSSPSKASTARSDAANLVTGAQQRAGR